MNLAQHQQESLNEDDRPRKISFHEPLTSVVHEIPRRTPEENLELFYQREDFALFQAKEQQRYDKMMMKRIQAMVTEAMKDELEAAYARNATQEEIDAMMPQTTEEIFELLGGIPTMETLKNPSASMHQEQMVKSDAVVDESSLGNDQDETTHPIDKLEISQHSKDSVESEGIANSLSSTEEVAKKERSEAPSQRVVDPTDAEFLEMQRRPEKSAEALTDEEILQLFSPCGEEATENDKYIEDGGESDDAEEVADVLKHQKFHLGNDNDDRSEIDIFNKIEKNDAVNDVLGTSFSSEAHVEDLVPLSPKHSPGHSPVWSTKDRPLMPMVNFDEDLCLGPSA